MVTLSSFPSLSLTRSTHYAHLLYFAPSLSPLSLAFPFTKSLQPPLPVLRALPFTPFPLFLLHEVLSTVPSCTSCTPFISVPSFIIPFIHPLIFSDLSISSPPSPPHEVHIMPTSCTSCPPFHPFPSLSPPRSPFNRPFLYFVTIIYFAALIFIINRRVDNRFYLMFSHNDFNCCIVKRHSVLLECIIYHVIQILFVNMDIALELCLYLNALVMMQYFGKKIPH